MLTERQDLIVQAAGQLDPATEFTADDKPKVDALNEWLESAGHEPTDAAERDEAWAAVLAQIAADAAAEASAEPILEDAPQGFVSIVVTDAPMNPVPLYVHGLGRWSLPVNGEPQSLPREALSALDSANVLYKEI
jgi:hypothetical protein